MRQNKKSPSVSIVVLNWNGQKFIDLFLPSLIKQDYDKDRLEIVFVDNQSSDNSLEYIKQKYKNIKNLRIVENAGNYGYAKGNNEGIKTCKSNFILVCNNDLELEKNAISSLLSCALDNDADVVVPKLMYYKDRKIINNAGSRLDENSNWPIYEIGTNEKDSSQFNKNYEVSAFCGACVLFKRSFFEEVGLFDEKFFMYFEDGDLSWRGQKLGKTYLYEPKAVVYHYHTGTSVEGSALFNFYVARNRVLILIKNARLKVILSGFKATLKDHLIFRIKNILYSLFGQYGKKVALVEFYKSQKVIFSIIINTPIMILKRIELIKEATL